MRLLALAALALVAGQAHAENYYKHNFSIGGGGAQPRGDLNGLFATSPLMNIGYGYRFHPMFQADVGLDMSFGAAEVTDYLNTGFGPLRIKDYQYFLPFGGRVIVPLGHERFRFSAGGGGAYMRYSERVRQPSQYFRVDCPVCTSRDGVGYYGLAAFSAAIDRGNHFRVGATGKVYRGHTNGEPLGAAPPVETRDHWINVVADFTFSF